MINTLIKRKSVRSFTGEMITDEELQIIFKACDASPVGLKQYESLHLIIVTNKELLNAIEQCASKMFNKQNMHPLYNAPMLIIICSKENHQMENVMYSNAAIMAHNIALASTELNVGSCYIWGAIASLQRDDELLEKLNIPSGFIPCCAVAIGKTNDKYEDKDIPERIKKTFIK